MNFFNPYDIYPYQLTSTIPNYDKPAFRKYKEHNYVYDKLFVATSQGIMAGILDELNLNKLNTKNGNNIKFPIFIKPRWGHKSATSKNCYKINNVDELNNYKHIKEMMWSEYIEGVEGMTDFFMSNGQIIYQITYKYSKEQRGYIEVWKYISSKNKPPDYVVNWIQIHLRTFTGPVNIQYRGDKIIEVGLRCARGGAYINSTMNKTLIQNINNLIDNNDWNYSIDEKLEFEPFWSFKCYINIPLIYILPQYLLDLILQSNNVLPFYEYYFEPNGRHGMVFLQFLHKNFDQGIKLKNLMERIFYILQYLFYILLVIAIILFVIDKKLCYSFVVVCLLIYLTQLLNPIIIIYNLYKIKRNMCINKFICNNN